MRQEIEDILEQYKDSKGRIKNLMIWKKQKGWALYERIFEVSQGADYTFLLWISLEEAAELYENVFTIRCSPFVWDEEKKELLG